VGGQLLWDNVSLLLGKTRKVNGYYRKTVLFLEVCFLVYATICFGESSFKVSLSKVPFLEICMVFFLAVLDDIL